MVVQHNLSAMNANRMLVNTTKSQKVSTERLSSGYKINRAADDAAGLSISEKMRSQIRGLTQASENCQDGVSLVQIGDGALAEIQDMLHRCTELTIKSANGTNTTADRMAIQEEITQILEEIDGTAGRTSFNTLPILLGEEDAGTGVDSTSKLPGWVKMPAGGHMSEGPALINGTSYNAVGNVDFSSLNAGNVKQLLGTGFHFTCCTCDHYYSIEFGSGTSGGISSNSMDTSVYKVGIDGIKDGAALVNRIVSVVGKNPNSHYTELEASGGKLLVYDQRPGQTAGGDYGVLAPGVMKEHLQKGLGEIVIQAGASADPSNQIRIDLPSVTTKSMGISNLDVTTQENALAAIEPIEKASAYVSGCRSMFGADQNRLEHTIRNLDNVVENTTAAESAIRDTDMAAEMVAFSNQNILAQAGQSMLAQANQNNQGVLSLLQ